MAMKGKKYISLLLRILISFGLISYFLWRMAGRHGGLGEGLRHYAAGFADAPFHWLLVAGLMHIVGFSLLSLRWKILLGGQGVKSSFWQLFSYNFMAAFFNLMLPSTIGGDAVRTVESRRLTGSTTTSAMVVIIERLTGLMALILIASVGLVVSAFTRAGGETRPWFFLLLALACFAAVILLAHPRIAPRLLRLSAKLVPAKVQGFLEKAYAAVEVYYRKPRSLFLAQAVSLVFQFNMVLYWYVIAMALNQHPDLLEFLIKGPVVIFLLMVVPAINGMGVRTASFMTLMGYTEVVGFQVESIDIGFRYVYGLLGGLVYLFYRRRKDKK